MPIYIYEHPKTHKQVEVQQKMTDLHEFIDEKGVKYNRVFLSTKTCVDTLADPWSKEAWMRKTAKRGMTIGDMMNESAALSEKRAVLTGRDPIKQKVFDDYTKKTGKDHPENRPKRIENEHVILDL